MKKQIVIEAIEEALDKNKPYVLIKISIKDKVYVTYLCNIEQNQDYLILNLINSKLYTNYEVIDTLEIIPH